jgi:squalene/oxidosqualene cyclase-like protein
MSYDVAIVGGGPVGCVAALAHARRGARVLVLEANPKASQRLAGEWLHPPAYEILQSLGVGEVTQTSYPSGRGFAVFPDDGSEPIALDYTRRSRGFSIEHAELVARLRAACRDHETITYLEPARAVGIDGQRLRYHRGGGPEHTVSAALIIGAAGRSNVVHEALGVDHPAATYSRMAGVLLEEAELPFPGYGHVFLGGPGPVLGYRIDARHVRLCLDVPLSLPVGRAREAVIWEAFAPILPRTLHRAFFRALETRNIAWASNQDRPRLAYGREGLALVGDAVGHHHPLTAIGMTLGFQDAVALAEARSVAAYRRARLKEGRVPEMLAVALYEVFADASDELVAIRQAVYDMWRRDRRERERTMRYLACQDAAPLRFGGSFVRAVTRATSRLVVDTAKSGQWRHSARMTVELADRCRWLLSGALRLSDARPTKDFANDDTWGPALKAARASAEVVEHPSRVADAQRRRSAQRPHVALERGIDALVREQNRDGSFEGECIWNAMLPAQYVIACHITETPIAEERRRRILLQFASTQLPSGTWGMHELSEPYLFSTALVYVAARLLGVGPSDPLLARARRFIADEGGVVAIPSWGKFWLALVGLYDWKGVNPVLPEVWTLPRWLPIHPSNYYCHTRLIYLGMACLYGETVPVREPGLLAALRAELYPQGYDAVSFDRARHQLRGPEIFTPPSASLKAAYDALHALDARALSKSRREGLREELREHIRFEFRSTDYTCISPVNGLLNLVALWVGDPEDEVLERAIARFDGWMFEDDVDGTRIVGARSASWDTAFALQALTAAAPHFDVTDAVEKADAFLATQQIDTPQAVDYARFFRIDPRGGYCFAGVWHGWPVSDCTAEALIARLEGPVGHATEREMTEGVRFILRTQCPDGGFGSYEPFRPVIDLEWLNPAEMFGDSMTEHAYVECTASCVAALAAFRARFPHVMTDRVNEAIQRGVTCIRSQQRPDGSFSGNWGVHFIYGTMFGIRGLLAAGVPPQDPAIRKACRWLRARQRPDGGWGESHRSCLEDRYLPHAEGQVIQSAWALSALLEAKDPDFDAIDRAACFLAERQRSDGTWPKEDPAGVFFHTALLHYELYRAYFPVWALGLYESRRLEREALLDDRARRASLAMA